MGIQTLQANSTPSRCSDRWTASARRPRTGSCPTTRKRYTTCRAATWSGESCVGPPGLRLAGSRVGMGEVARQGRSARHGRPWIGRRHRDIEVITYAQRPIDDLKQRLLVVAKIKARREAHGVPGVKCDVLGHALGESGARDVPGQLEEAEALLCRDPGPPAQVLVD